MSELEEMIADMILIYTYGGEDVTREGYNSFFKMKRYTGKTCDAMLAMLINENLLTIDAGKWKLTENGVKACNIGYKKYRAELNNK